MGDTEMKEGYAEVNQFGDSYTPHCSACEVNGLHTDTFQEHNAIHPDWSYICDCCGKINTEILNITKCKRA